MQIDDQLIFRLEHLNRLELTPAERVELKADLNRILQMVDKLNELDLRGVDPLVHLHAVANPLREDERKEALDRADALRDAPDHDGTFFRVPKVIDL